ncbi:MAG: biopolymer transporter ExbD [Bacteriovoracaceae bacterium]|nr:biopolymer transporter ExbD [Bacteriovoracaceae bacterium]
MGYFKREQKKRVVKPNLIPILDAVFIFIFFLLMSAQFVDIYEIGSDAPAISTIEHDSDKNPLNLVLEISRTNITVKKGLDGRTVKRLSVLTNGEFDLESLNSLLINIKKDNMKEESIIFRPSSTVPYAKLVKIMDSVREVKGEDNETSFKNNKGELVVISTLFNRVIFETII